MERNYQINELDFNIEVLYSNLVNFINEWVWWSLSHSLWTSVCVTKLFTWFSMIGSSVQKGFRGWQLEHCRSGWRCIEGVWNSRVIYQHFNVLHKIKNMETSRKIPFAIGDHTLFFFFPKDKRFRKSIWGKVDVRMLIIPQSTSAYFINP